MILDDSTWSIPEGAVGEYFLRGGADFGTYQSLAILQILGPPPPLLVHLWFRLRLLLIPKKFNQITKNEISFHLPVKCT